MSQPNLPKVRLEVYDQADLAYCDDNFRDGWAAQAPNPASESLVNVGGTSADYAVHTVDSSGATKDSKYEKDINPPFVISTATYAKCRVRVWTGSGTPEYRVQVYDTLGFNFDSGWRDAQSAPEVYELSFGLTRTINELRISVRDKNLTGTVSVHWDYIIICKTTSPWVPTDLTWGGDANKCLVTFFKHSERFRDKIVIKDCTIRLYYDHSLQSDYPAAGHIVFLYAAALYEHDTTDLREKLFRGRVKKVTQPTRDLISYVELYCVDLIEDLQDDFYSAEYEPTATAINVIVENIIAAIGVKANLNWWEMTYDSTPATNNSIVKVYKNRPGLDLLNELAGTAQWVGPIYGAHVFLDVGGDIHFQELGNYSGWFNVTEDRIEKVLVAEEDIDNIINDVTLVYEEESVYPGDKNQWDETDEDGGGAPDSWSESPLGATFVLDGADYKSGVGSCRCTYVLDPGNNVTISRAEVNRVNWIYADRIKFWVKRGFTLDANGISVHIVTAYGLLGASYHDSGWLASPAVNTWVELNLARTTFSLVSDPGDDVVNIEFLLRSAVGLGPGSIRFDKIRFVHDEKNANAADAASKTAHGVHKRRFVNTNFKSQAEADDWAENFLEAHKDPRIHAIVKLLNIHNLAGAQGAMPYRPGVRQQLSLRHTALNINAEYTTVLGTTYTYDAMGADPWSAVIELGNDRVVPMPLPDVNVQARDMADLQRMRQDERSELAWHR